MYYYCYSILIPPSPQLKEPVRSADVVSGHTHAVAGLLGTVRYSNLGLPSAKAKVIPGSIISSCVVCGFEQEVAMLMIMVE